jgi:16S rRNA (cytosine1402-N4)-methyltransferase
MLEHTSVLLKESISFLNPYPGGNYVDCTLGLGGHAEEILENLHGEGLLIALDRDIHSLEHAKKRLGERYKNALFFRDNFKNLALILGNLGIDRIDGCLIDLGVSFYQLTDPRRGFSFRETGPLDMRMDQGHPLTAEHLINHLTEDELAEVIRKYGEEPQARKIAAAIVRNRKNRRIRTTTDLADLVESVKGRDRRSKIHPATRVFQALRIEVNQELSGLGKFLSNTIQLLTTGGRLAVISFHSLEDRIVKKTFQLEAGRCICFKPGDLCRCPRIKNVEILTRKPIGPSQEEVTANPSARSAKLRVVERRPDGEMLRKGK